MNIEKIVENELCTGCGVCISEDRSNSAKMIWSKEGFWIPKVTIESTQDDMITVCPFSSKLNEDQLGQEIFKDSTNYDSKIGFYNQLFVGYSQIYRKTSSSGGIATFVFNELLKNKIVDYLFVVKNYGDSYAYQLIKNIDDISQISKTRYTPVTLEQLFLQIDKIEGKVAVSGVACFVKAIRLKQIKNPQLKEKIPFIVGIICGGLKSKYYTDFLAQSAGCLESYDSAQYRVKNSDSFALDYKFACNSKSNNKIYMIDMQSLGDMWGTGLFKSNACDFCDDVMTELADISLGDAWITPYDKDGLGNSIVLARSDLASKIINNGIKNKELILNILTKEEAIKSQQGSFNHRHKGLALRCDYANRNKKLIPIKRSRFIEKQNIFFNIVQKNRLITRKLSLSYWVEANSIEEYMSLMQPKLNHLKFVTKLNHKFLRLIDKLKKVTSFKG